MLMIINTDEIILLSDLHLDEADPEISAGFLAFSDQISNRQTSVTVFILGDLFESWIGDDILQQPSLWLSQMITALQKIAASAPTYFIHGNRDFLIGQAFEQRTGIQCLAEITNIQWQHFKITLCHGDHLCTQDADYMNFRTLVRSQTWQDNFLQKTIPERLAIAQSLRQQSQAAHTTKTDAILDVNTAAVQVLTANTDLLIHGHTHRPAIHHSNDPNHSPRIVLGDWAPHPSWLTLAFLSTGAISSPALQGQLQARDWSKNITITG